MGDGNFQLPRRFDSLLQGAFRNDNSNSSRKIAESGGSLSGPGSSNRKNSSSDPKVSEKSHQTVPVQNLSGVATNSHNSDLISTRSVGQNTPIQPFSTTQQHFRPQFLPLHGFPRFRQGLSHNTTSAPATLQGVTNPQLETSTIGSSIVFSNPPMANRANTSTNSNNSTGRLPQNSFSVHSSSLQSLSSQQSFQTSIPSTLDPTYDSRIPFNVFSNVFSSPFEGTGEHLLRRTRVLENTSSGEESNISENSLVQLVQSRALPSAFPSSQSGSNNRTFQSYGFNSSALLVRSDTVTKTGKVKKTPISPQKSQTIRPMEDTIIGSYERDLDLRSLHNMIITQMESINSQKMLEIRAKYDKANKGLNTVQHVTERGKIVELIYSLRRQMAELMKNTQRDKYLLEVTDILKQYEALGPLTESIDFTSDFSDQTEIIDLSGSTESINPAFQSIPSDLSSQNPSIEERPNNPLIQKGRNLGSPYEYSYKGSSPKTDDENDSQQEYRHTIISKFLQIASRYITLDIVRIYPKHCRGDCGVCGCNVYQDTVKDGEPIMCQNCGTEVLIVVKATAPVSPQAGPSPQRKKGEYANWKTTEFRYLCIQGRVTVELPEGYEDKLDGYFKSIGKPIGREIRQMPLQDNGKRGSVTIPELLKALAKVGLSKQFELVHLIAEEYFGWKLPDYSSYDDKFTEYYEKSEEGFRIFKGDDRSSTMNSWYRLWWLLNLIGIPYPKEDLRMITTRTTRDYYDLLRKQISDYYGWPHLENLSGFGTTVDPEDGEITVDWE